MRKVKIHIILVIFILILVLVPFFFTFTKVSGVDITVQYPNDKKVLSKDIIEEDLSKKYGDFTSYRRRQINTKDIKAFLESNSFAEHAIVSLSLTGRLQITIIQSHIIARVYNLSGQQYYIDNNGKVILPGKKKETAEYLIVSGDIKENPKNLIDSLKYPDSYNIYSLSLMIDTDTVLTNWISEIRKDKKKWYLIPKQGDYVITLGVPADWEEELLKLHYLYEYNFKTEGWSDYINIDPRFYNQIVCRKKTKADNGN